MGAKLSRETIAVYKFVRKDSTNYRRLNPLSSEPDFMRSIRDLVEGYNQSWNTQCSWADLETMSEYEIKNKGRFDLEAVDFHWIATNWGQDIPVNSIEGLKSAGIQLAPYVSKTQRLETVEQGSLFSV